MNTSSIASPLPPAPVIPPIVPASRHRLRRRHWHSPAEILEILDTIAASSQPLRKACKACQITLPTYYRWLKLRQRLEEKLIPSPRAWDEPAHSGGADPDQPAGAPLSPAHPHAPPSTPSHAEQCADLERENHHLRETLVQMAVENTRLRRVIGFHLPALSAGLSA